MEEKKPVSKKPIYATAHGLKFFKADNWLFTELVECCRRGEVQCYHPYAEDAFYILTPGSSFNSHKLLEKGTLVRARWDERKDLTDEQYIVRFNY